MQEEIKDIFDRITEKHAEPINISDSCQSYTYYHILDLTDEDLNLCAKYVAESIYDQFYPEHPDFFMKLPGGYSYFAERLCAMYEELLPPGTINKPELIIYSEKGLSNGVGDRVSNKTVVLVTDVITTARSSIEAHTKATLRGVNVACWATLIDRTFGPGPVPIFASLVGDPVIVVK